jgi:hypothetical protein
MNRIPNPLPDQDLDELLRDVARRRQQAPRFAWVTGLLTVAAFFGVLNLAERNDNSHAEQMARINAELDATDARMERAAALLCQAEAGPGAQVLWTQDGDLVCRPAVMTAQVRP